MLQGHVAVARVALQTESSKGFRGGVYAGRVTARTTITKAFFVPRQFIHVDPFINLIVRAKHRLSIQQGELPIAILLKEANAMAAAEKVFNLSSHTR